MEPPLKGGEYKRKWPPQAYGLSEYRFARCNMEDFWQQIKNRLASSLPPEGFQSWIAATTQHSLTGTDLTVRVPSPTVQEWIETEYLPHIQLAIAELRLPVSNVRFVCAQAASGAANGAVNGTHSNGANGHSADYARPLTSPGESYSDKLFDSLSLNPKYTFEHFVVGSSNEFAHAAARAVSERPGQAYNPLFIYGGAGLGKSHLLHAIGHHLLDNSPNLRVICTTGERFMNQLVNCIRTDQMPKFHEFFRTADVLLVDDVHTMAGRERTQEEFFHTFNELFDRQKQIVLSSDSPPKNTQGLVDRLRSRFEWGLMVDIQAPDLETKMAILERRAQLAGLTLPEDVCVFLATRIRTNIRELEGALRRLEAFSSVSREQITLAMAHQVLRPLGAGGPERRVTIDAIIKAVAEKFSLQSSQLKQKGNMRNIAYPRQIAMYLAKELTQASLPEIGRAFGGKHHTTVLHSVNKISRERQTNVDLNRMIHSLIETLQ